MKINKLYIKNIKNEEVEYDTNIEILRKRERDYINKYDSYNNGYNSQSALLAELG